jgi:hypothetical protein
MEEGQGSELTRDRRVNNGDGDNHQREGERFACVYEDRHKKTTATENVTDYEQNNNTSEKIECEKRITKGISKEFMVVSPLAFLTEASSQDKIVRWDISEVAYILKANRKQSNDTVWALT